MAIHRPASQAIGKSASVHDHFDRASVVPSGSWQGKARATAKLSVGSDVNAASIHCIDSMFGTTFW
jgi:hypothetical protein